MEKECDYCGEGFEAKRSDAKYCSGSCKNNAYLARKANPEIANVSDNSTINGNSMSNRRINVQPSIPLSSSSINRMIQGLGNNTDILNNLLAEKDNAGEAKASITEYKIRLLFMERDLQMEKEKTQNLQKSLDDLEAENLRLTEKVEASGGSLSDKALAFCESNPEVLMTILNKLTNSGIGNFMTDQERRDIQNDLKREREEKNDIQNGNKEE